MYTRLLNLEDAKTDTVFLWGARQTGKSTLLKTLFPGCRYYDLLKGEQFERYNRRPEFLREELMMLYSMQTGGGLSDNPAQAKLLRKQIARILTVKNELR